ncbi:DNA helicase PcrA [Mycobacterium sp. CBMA293]|uniref:DNA helicase PcrA n=3 Tax=Mycolicibacterium TaxID=1866885 RepID=UPI0012DE9422|nr:MULTISPECIES: DNA helicase PcrA [unclassified Mycolicibacterium]MUL49610.1 DNA helicase PcrA [Mycolicibacterium sp. CBMA 360]MUL61557.1 DNA helicase PcrA [Mycolicibacterium sp. CBMA 335]MUL74292.1 DNA helicase PcrA [Mycolicibacterium sp. CBMA 311]MUL97082.1 DNA helicase PcrA [Mycolicibacterium sp. CBMA 230]MUM04272.1 DNA helicase PcrA [Mycolicibacterium sp. CBMA 213]
MTSAAPDTDQLLDGLNPEQRQAVQHAGSPLLIVAGAGSGKTAVLTRRIAYLLGNRDVGVGQILAITFTNKAAAEMRERVVQLIGPQAKSMWVSTFHSTCVRILRNQASLLPGLNSNFSIYDADDSRRLLMMVAKDLNLDVKRYSPRMLATAISNLKNELIDPLQAASEASEADEDLPRIVAEVYGEYQRRLRAANAMDFDDLIGETVAVLQSFPQIAQYYRRRFRHILVDEYQDTNHAQYVLVRELVGHHAQEGADDVPPAELCVVGDADQSIYAFRGATIRNIEDFERDFPNAKTILLEQNYRSTQNILSAANGVISRNAGRRDKKLWTDAGEGELIVGYVADNEHDEARFIAEEIDTLTTKGSGIDTKFTYGDVAVFYRTNNSSRSVEDIFIRAGIPYKVVGGMRFYERKEIRDIVAYLRVLDNPGDAVSMRRILNTPRRGIGDRAEACVAVYAENTGASFNEALQAAAEGRVPMLNSRSEKAIAGFVELMDSLRGGLDGDLGDLVETVLDRTGYRRELEASSDPQDQARLDNLNELVSVAHEFSTDLANAQGLQEEALDEDIPDTGALAAFLERVSLVADADEIPEDGDGVVTMMTLHTAKGLEFPVVFVTGWEDGMFPHMRALGDPTELSEERRLAYVGITRARQRLYLSRAKVRSSWGQPMLNPESRFLQEIPQELIDWRRVEPPPSLSAPSRYGAGGSGGSGGGLGGGRPSPMRPAPNRNKPLVVLSPGDRVTHDKYGLGRVEEVSGVGESAMSLIDFGSAGRVKLMHNHAPVQRL